MKKNKTYNIDEELIIRVNKHSNDTGITKSKIVEFALKEYLDKQNVH